MRYFIDDLLEDWPGRVMLGLMLAFIVFIPIAIYDSIQEHERWEAFKVSAHCKIVSEVSPSSGLGIGPTIGGNGGVAVTVVTIPGKTGWLCDDGITYYK